MGDNTVIVKFQEADKVVKSYANSVNDFKEHVNAEIRNMESTVSAMGRSWEGDLYDSFKQNMESHLGRMTSCTSGLNDLSEKLEVISKKFSEAIATLKQTSGR